MFIFILITAVFLSAASLSMFLTNKAGHAGHDDKGGRFYYLSTGLLGIVYTIQNVMNLLREVS